MTSTFLPTLRLANETDGLGATTPLVSGVDAVLGWKLSAARLETLNGVAVDELAPAGEPPAPARCWRQRVAWQNAQRASLQNLSGSWQRHDRHDLLLLIFGFVPSLKVLIEVV